MTNEYATPMTIQEITNIYKGKLDYLDLEILIANSLGKTREFVLMCPEHVLTKSQISNLKSQIARRLKCEPIAYLVGHKEFYGLDFIVNGSTLVPRPETEMMVEAALDELRIKNYESCTIVDIGTGSGCIIISIASILCHFEQSEESRKITSGDIKFGIFHHIQDNSIKYFATDVSAEALKVAKKNAKIHKLGKQIKFIKGDLLEPIIKKIKSSVISHQSLVITANLPYLSKEIYQSAPVDVKKYEPKTALYSAEAGLAHYRKLLEQLSVACHTSHVTCFFEISPEQKTSITKLIKSILPTSKIEFTKDLAGKWRLCKISL